MNDSHARLVERLSILGVSTLVGFLGHEKASRLQELGLQLSSRTLAEFMISDHGVEIFKDRQVRSELILSVDTAATNVTKTHRRPIATSMIASMTTALMSP